MLDSRAKIKHDAAILNILTPSTAFLCCDLRNGVLTSSGILFLTAFLWFWPYSPGDTAMATFTWIMMIIHAAIGVGGFLAVFGHLNLESYARVACILWIVVWVFMLVQIGSREDICEEHAEADSFEDCKDFLYTSRLISILSWTFVGGYHHLLVSSYKVFLEGPARKKRMSTQFHKKQRKEKRSQASSLGVGPSKDLSGFWQSAPHGYTFRLEHSKSNEPGLYDVYNDNHEMWAHVKYLGPLLGHELQLTYADTHSHEEVVHGTFKADHGMSMVWSDGDTWKHSTPQGFGGTHAPDSHHHAGGHHGSHHHDGHHGDHHDSHHGGHHDSHHGDHHDSHHGGHHDSHHGGHHDSHHGGHHDSSHGAHARHHSDHGHHDDHHGHHGGHSERHHDSHHAGHHDSHHGGHHDSHHRGGHHDSHHGGHHDNSHGTHARHHSDHGHHDDHHRHHSKGDHHDTNHHDSHHSPRHHSDHGHHDEPTFVSQSRKLVTGVNEPVSTSNSHHAKHHDSHHDDHHGHHSKGDHHDDHHGHPGERHTSGDHDHPLTGNWDTKYGYVFRLEYDGHDMYEVFNEEDEMWATVKHHREKNGDVPENAVTLVYTESSSQRVSGHYSHGLLHWNDGDTWEKSTRTHGRHPHHEEVDVAHTDTPEPPPGPSDSPPKAKDKSSFLAIDSIDRRGSFHKQQPSTGDPFLDKAFLEKEEETLSPSKTPARASTNHPSY